MFIQTVTLSRNGWHSRLQRRMLGPLDTFSNFCPYFWLTVFCVMVSPFYFGMVMIRGFFSSMAHLVAWAYHVLRGPLIRALEALEGPANKVYGIIGKVAEFLVDIMDEAICLPTERVFLEHMDSEQIKDMYLHSRDYISEYKGIPSLDEAWDWVLHRIDGKREREKWARMDRKFQIWKGLAGDDWKARLDAMIKQGEEDEALRQKQQADRIIAEKNRKDEREAARRRHLNLIVKYTKFVAPTLAAAVILVLGFFVGKILIWIIPIVIHGIPGFVKAIGGGLRVVFIYAPAFAFQAMMTGLRMVPVIGWIFIVSVPFVIVSLAKLSKKCDLEIPFIKIDRVAGKIAKTVVAPFIWFGRSVASVMDFFIEYFKLFKKNHCPQINWVD